jgi:hypothetical protein
MLPNTPVYDQALKGHVISFKEPVLFVTELESIDGSTPVDVSGNPVFEGIVREFLSSSARYFSRPLEYEQFQRRATHTWLAEQGVLFRPASGVIYKVEWQLERVIFYANRYEAIWRMQAVQPVVVAAACTAAPPPAAIEAETLPSPVPKGVEVETATIPFRTATAEEREKLKRSIRHARLRIALAQLRAERLAEKYYRRYGSWDGADGEEEGSDSDLSVDSVGGIAPPATAENIGSR